MYTQTGDKMQYEIVEESSSTRRRSKWATIAGILNSPKIDLRTEKSRPDPSGIGRIKRRIACKNKKSLIPFALLAAYGAAAAQSSVTFFGIVDLSITRVSGGGVGHVTGLASGQGLPGRLGFRGTEDLGGGLTAGFWLEGEIFADTGNTGNPFFNRRSTVSLLGSFGEVRLGRDFAPTYLSASGFDPFGNRGAGTVMSFNNFGGSTARNNNSVTYFLPATLGGVYGAVQYAFGEALSTVPNDKQGNYLGARLGYANGPWNVALAAGEYKQFIGASNVPPVAIGSDLEISNIGGSYDFNFAKVLVFYGEEKLKNGLTGANKVGSLMIAATIPLGVGELRASVSRYDTKESANDWRKFAIGYVHYLSKRTQLYGAAGLLENKSGSSHTIVPNSMPSVGTLAGRNSNGIDIGVRHSF
jgi:predicted porin